MSSLRVLLAHNMKERRRILGITLVQLAEKVNTSTYYIGQIELGNKFPAPEMLERLATALEIDNLQFFSMDSYPAEIIRQFQEVVLADVKTAIVNYKYVLRHTLYAERLPVAGFAFGVGVRA
jgi:transcriptional regulator with XRE-family HTH domain